MGSQRSTKITIMLIFILTIGFSLTSCFIFFMEWEEEATDTIVYLIDENFDDSADQNWVRPPTDYWSISAGQYLLSITTAMNGSKSSYYNEAGNLTFNDFTFEADVMQLGGNITTMNQAGLFFRVNDGGSTYGNPPMYTGYRLYIQTFNAAASSYWALEKGDGIGGFTPVQAVAFGNNNANINSVFGNFNKIKVVCQGSQIDVYFNDVLIGSYTDSAYTSGYVGLFGYGATIEANDFVFDNVRLW